MSYQYCSYLYDHKILLRSYICFYCPFTYENSVIFIIIYFKLSQNFDFITNICSVVVFLDTSFTKNKIKFTTFNFRSSTTSAETKLLLPKPSYHSNTENYQGSAGHGEVDIDSDINCLDSGNLWQDTTVISHCEQLHWT